MVVSHTLELPCSKGIGRKRECGFGALAQGIGRTAIAFLRKYIVPAAKRVGADLLEFAVPEVADVVSGKKIFKTAAKSVGRQALRKQLGGGKQKRSIPIKKLKRSSRSRRDILLILQSINDRSKQFLVPTFCCSFWESWCESPSCGRCVVFSRTRTLSHYIS